MAPSVPDSVSGGIPDTAAPPPPGFVEKAEHDERDYKTIVLENKMEVLLIHDKEADKAAAAMDVKVGQLNDPKHAMGLAHFCEHMLFLGTAKYPDEGAYNAFLNGHGGSSNAYTDMEQTNYYFDVNQEHLEGALDIFSNFFKEPLFTEGATDREMNAVDSENSKNLQSDTWRTIQLYKTLALEDHPFSQFGTGNLQTLKDDPLAAGVNIREELLRFYNSQYSANRMKLSVLGRHSIADLEAMVRSNFEEVENKDLQRPPEKGSPFTPDLLGRRLNVVPVKDIRQVQVAWILPSVQAHWRTKPLNYMSHLLGHEGEGSLLSLLKRKGWANELGAGEFYSTSEFSTFTVSVDCTDEGMKCQDDVVSAIFSYIEVMKKVGPQEETFKELSAVSAMNFRFSSKTPPAGYVSRLVSNMQHFPVDKCLSGPRLYEHFDPALISRFTDLLTPDMMLLVVQSKANASLPDLCTERWYGTQYTSEKVDSANLAKWTNPPTEPSLHLPEPNPMIATDFSLRSTGSPPVGSSDAEVSAELNRPPEVVPDGPPGTKLWYKQDRFFKRPILNFRLSMATPAIYESPEAFILAELLQRILTELLNEEDYLAQQAGLHSGVYLTRAALCIDFSGYNHKLSVLVERVMRQVAIFQGGADAKFGSAEEEEAVFQRLREKLDKEMTNSLYAQPYELAMSANSECMQLPKWSLEEKLAACRLPSVSLRAVKLHGARVLGQMSIEALVHGNATKEEARALLDIVTDALGDGGGGGAAVGDTAGVDKAKRGVCPLPEALYPDTRTVCLDEGKAYTFRKKASNPEEPCSAVEVIYQAGPETMELAARLQLLMHLINDKAFEQLRTKEQLGYIVFTGTVSQADFILGARFIVMSSTSGPLYLEERIEAFIDGFQTFLEELSPEKFVSNVQAVIDHLLQKVKSLGEENRKHWKEVSIRRYTFDRSSKLAEAVKALSLEDIKHTLRTYLLSSSPHRRKFTASIYGAEQPHVDVVVGEKEGAGGGGGGAAAAATAVGGTAEVVVVKDATEFRRSMPLYPLRPRPAEAGLSAAAVPAATEEPSAKL